MRKVRRTAGASCLRSALCLIGIAVLIGCAGLDPRPCANGQERRVTEYLYFGTAKPAGGQVFADDWRQFLDDVVTPRFPEGLSVWQAAGQWKPATGPIVREPAYVLNIVHASGEAAERAVAEVVSVYKARFQQEAVLRVTGVACVSF